MNKEKKKLFLRFWTLNYQKCFWVNFNIYAFCFMLFLSSFLSPFAFHFLYCPHSFHFLAWFHSFHFPAWSLLYSLSHLSFLNSPFNFFKLLFIAFLHCFILNNFSYPYPFFFSNQWFLLPLDSARILCMYIFLSWLCNNDVNNILSWSSHIVSY